MARSTAAVPMIDERAIEDFSSCGGTSTFRSVSVLRGLLNYWYAYCVNSMKRRITVGHSERVTGWDLPLIIAASRA